MRNNQHWHIAFLFILLIAGSCTTQKQESTEFTSHWPEGVHRTWIGPEFWANRLQDWQLNNGRIECLTSETNRNINLLTWRLGEEEGEFSMKVTTGLITGTLPRNDKNWLGFRIGAKGQFQDYRDDAIYGKGLNVGITTGGDLFIGEPSVKQNGNARALIPYLDKALELEVSVQLKEGKYRLLVSATDPATGELLAEIVESDIPEQSLHGSIALVSHFTNMDRNNNIPGGWFDDWILKGSKISNDPDRTFGPVLFSQYTLSRGVLKMTAQMPPVGEDDGKEVYFQIPEKNDWKTIETATIDPLSRTATFRLDGWDHAKDTSYRLAYSLNTGNRELTEFYYEGMIRKEPLDREELVVAGFTGNNDLGFPNNDLTEAIKYHDPDLLFFSGDQIYEGVGGFGTQWVPVDKAILDYLRKWYLFGWEYGELLRDRPCISIPDDHDVYHGNIWGAGGIATSPGLSGGAAQDAGGYKMPARWVKMVERTQTSHLPDPYDPTPIEQGIGVYYTELNYGGISFAILEDRKFKSAPKPLIPEAEIVNGFVGNKNWNAVEKGDVPGAVLLGQRQLDFIEQWAGDWSNHTWMKVVLSQTIFANVATLPEDASSDVHVPGLRILKEGEYPPDDRPVADMDSNGWPQTGRNEAIKKIRKAFAVHIAGDQHLGSMIRYGVDQWGDAGYAFCVPAVSNVWPRRWFPTNPGANRKEGDPDYTGDFSDGFGNKVTVLAVSNPVFTGQKPSNLYDRATGYGIIRFNKKTRKTVVECWPRFVDPSDADAKQYTGWPLTIDQVDNYGPEPYGWLPQLNISGMEDPVIKVFKDDELVYALRIKGSDFIPAIFEPGLYRIEAGDPDQDNFKVFTNLEAEKEAGGNFIDVAF